MKKLLALLLALLMLCACGTQTEIEEPQNEAEIFELGEGSRVLEACVFKTADEKYGIQKDGKIILPATYDEFKRVGELGGKTFYALGYKDGTKPLVVWNEDGMLTGTEETERTLYDIFDQEGNMLLSFPVDDFIRCDEKMLNVSLEGNFYTYTFSDDGEIEEEKVFKKGKTGKSIFGFDEVKYNYSASGLSSHVGLADSEGNIVVPVIYSDIEQVIGDRIIAKTRNAMVGFSAYRLYDSEGNMLCEKYSSIEYYEMGEGGFIGIGKCDYPEHQSPLICRDENGEIMPSGLWFIDKDGNALSERFDIDALEIEISAEDKTVSVTDVDGNKTVIPAEEYIFES